MIYATEHIASILKAARESKGLSQRELSKKAGVPQGHISKIENSAVDLRVSSLVALSRVLDLELMLVPRKVVSAVQSIARSTKPSSGRGGGVPRQVSRELQRLEDTLASLPQQASITKEITQLRRQVRDLQHFQLERSNLEAIRTANQAVQAFIDNTGNLSAIRQSLSQLQSLRNALAHGSANAPRRMDSARPAYSMDGDDDG